MTIRFINQENEEITKLNAELIHIKFKGNLRNTAEFPSVVLFLRLNWQIYSYFGNSTVFICFSWRSLRICYGARCVHFIVLSGRRGTLFFLRAQITESTAYLSKKFKPFLTSITMPKLLLNSELKKNIKKEFSCVMVFLMRPRSIFKFEFVFGWNECLWAIFSLLSFENF